MGGRYSARKSEPCTKAGSVQRKWFRMKPRSRQASSMGRSRLQPLPDVVARVEGVVMASWARCALTRQLEIDSMDRTRSATALRGRLIVPASSRSDAAEFTLDDQDVIPARDTRSSTNLVDAVPSDRQQWYGFGGGRGIRLRRSGDSAAPTEIALPHSALVVNPSVHHRAQIERVRRRSPRRGVGREGAARRAHSTRESCDLRPGQARPHGEIGRWC